MKNIRSDIYQNPVKAKSQDFTNIKVDKKNLTDEQAVLSERDADISFGKLLPSPDLIFKKLGKTPHKVYKQLLTDPHLKGLINSRKAGTLSLEWDIEQGEAPDNVYDAVMASLNHLDMYELANNILDATLYGYQPIELVYDAYNNIQVVAKASAKPFNWYSFDKDGSLRYKEDDFDEDGKETNPLKYLVPRHEASYANPFGQPLLSLCYWNTFFKTKGREMWAEFTEKFGSPHILVKYGNNADTGALESLYDSLVNMAYTGVVTVPSKYDPQIMNAAGGGNVNVFESLVESSQKENSILILGHSAAANSTPGKLGNESQSLEASDRIIKQDKRLVQKTINELIKKICAVNFGQLESYPCFTFIEAEDLYKERAERDNILVSANPNLTFTKKYYMDHYGFSEDDIEVMSQGVDQPQGKKSDIIASLEILAATPYQDLLDEFVDDILMDEDDNTSIMNKVLSAVVEFTRDASDYEDLDNYEDVFDDFDDDDYRGRIVRATFIAHLVGYHYATVETPDEENSVASIVAKETIDIDDIKIAFDRTPERAVEYFESKGLRVSSNWQDTLAVVKKHSFTVTGVTRLDILTDFKDLINKAIKGDLAFNEFKKQIKENIINKGWSHREVDGKVIEPHRLRTIYFTNTQEALQQSRNERFLDAKNTFPFVVQSSINDKRTTDRCDYLDGKVFRVDDPIYQKEIRPMGHFGCRRTEFPTRTLRGRKLLEGRSVAKKYRNAKGFNNKTKPWMPDLRGYANKLVSKFKKFIDR